MTTYQHYLLDQAVDMWQRGHSIPTDHYAKMAAEGLDVPALEAFYKQEK